MLCMVKLPDHLFEFVAIGTIADLVPLVGENRYLVQQGIKAYATFTKSLGIGDYVKYQELRNKKLMKKQLAFILVHA